MSRFQSVAVVVSPIGLSLGLEENPNPGTEGTTTSKASSGEPPKREGSVSGPIASRNSKTEPGQPWVKDQRNRLRAASLHMIKVDIEIADPREKLRVAI
jgi:hypothetical protein